MCNTRGIKVSCLETFMKQIIDVINCQIVGLLCCKISWCTCAFSGQVLGTICEELAPDGVILIYLSASGCVLLLYLRPLPCTFALSQSSKPALFLYLRKCKVGLPLTSFKLFQEELDTLFHLPQVLELLSTLQRTQWETFSLMPCTWMQSPFLHLAHQVIFQILLQGKVNRTACILVHVGMEVLFTISWTLPA
jgi:hypothetical protein